jgi:hypothetical protein
MVNKNGIITPVEVIERSGDKIKKVRITDMVFAVRDDCPSDIDPFSIAVDFLLAFDIKKSVELKDAHIPCDESVQITADEQNSIDIHDTLLDDKVVGIEHGVQIYYCTIIDIYHEFRDKTFTSVDVRQCILKYGYKFTSIFYLSSVARIYVRFLYKNEYIECVTKNRGKEPAVYRFVKSPLTEIQIESVETPNIEVEQIIPIVEQKDDVTQTISTDILKVKVLPTITDDLLKSLTSVLYTKFKDNSFMVRDICSYLKRIGCYNKEDLVNIWIKHARSEYGFLRFSDKLILGNARYVFVKTPYSDDKVSPEFDKEFLRNQRDMEIKLYRDK